MYTDAYEIVKQGDPKLETEFIKKYALSIFNLDVNKVSESASEIQDAINDVNKPSQSDSDSEEMAGNILNNEFVCEYECQCKLCELINAWDINVDLVYSEDPFQNIIMKGLMGIEC